MPRGGPRRLRNEFGFKGKPSGVQTSLNSAVLQACDSPPIGVADMFASLYRLCEVIKAQSTVALSGESADEVFGGYPWFHDPRAVNAGTYPWLAFMGSGVDGSSILDQDLLTQLKLPELQADSAGDR